MIAVLVFRKALNVIIFNRPKPIYNGKPVTITAQKAVNSNSYGKNKK